MKLGHRVRFAAFATAAVAALGVVPASAEQPTGRPWTDVKLPPEQRADLLLSQMTQDEQLSLLHGHFALFLNPMPDGIIPSAGYFPGVPRLGVPALKESDASLGVSNAGRANDDAIALPSGAALASSWDLSLAEAGGRMIGGEARAKGFNILLAGGVNLVRDPRNGRNFEYVGEDTLLAGSLAGASIRGVQSNHIVSTTKHYVLNAQETGRHVLNAVIDPAALRESDLLAFELAIERGRPGAIMCGYNKVNGAYDCENPLLQIPKTDWGWRGWVMSDWGAVHSTQAALAGLDQESGQEIDSQVFFDAPLKHDIASGAIPAARVHDMARRVLFGLFSTGVMDHPIKAGGLDTAADAPVAQRTAEEGIVLLKNRGGLLPLAKTARRIAVIGGHADVGVLSGAGSSQVIPLGSLRFPAPAGSPKWIQGIVYHPSAPLKALRAHSPGAEISFDPGSDPAKAATLAKAADVAIVFATQWATEGQDTSLALDGGQDALIQAVAAANPHTIVVLETGNPVLMPWLDKVPAVVEAWYPGSRGGEALARVLTGEVDASGRLAVTFPASADQLPRPELPGLGVTPPEDQAMTAKTSFDVNYVEGADVGYRWFEKTGRTPAFPFGFGLSYTQFHFGGLKLEGGANLTVSFEATNTGTRPGVAVPQVYAAGPGQTRRLIGWSRLSLQPGETRHVTVTADPRLLADFDTAAHNWRLAAGAYRVSVGASVADTAISGEAQLAEARIKP